MHASLHGCLGPCWGAIAILGLTVGLSACQEATRTQAVLDSELEAFRASEKVERLLAGMTLEDKVGEMTQLTLDMLCVEDSAKTRK